MGTGKRKVIPTPWLPNSVLHPFDTSWLSGLCWQFGSWSLWCALPTLPDELLSVVCIYNEHKFENNFGTNNSKYISYLETVVNITRHT
jgi:hypothetical protein